MLWYGDTCKAARAKTILTFLKRLSSYVVVPSPTNLHFDEVGSDTMRVSWTMSRTTEISRFLIRYQPMEDSNVQEINVGKTTDSTVLQSKIEIKTQPQCHFRQNMF